MFYLYLAGLTALLWSISGIIIKGVSSKFGNLRATAMVGIGNVIMLSIVVLLLGNLSIGTYASGMSIAAGIITGIGYILFYRSLQHQRASNTYSIIEIQVVILFLYGVLVLGEAVSPIDIIGIAVIVFGTIAVSIEKAKFNIGLLPAMGAQVFWALGWILLVYPISATRNFVLPNLISFGATLAMVCVLLVVFGKRAEHGKKMAGSDLAVGVSAGLASGSGNAVYALLIYMKDLALSAPIANSTPAIIAVIARFVYKERLSVVQYLGIAAVVIGAAILTV
jgi:drug/metabolite transporter (DMT)-like permease